MSSSCRSARRARSDGTVDLGFVERVTEELGAVVADRSSFLAIVYRSTVPPGTVDGRLRPILERVSGRRAGDGFGVGMVPEFLREGSGVDDFFAPPFTVAGVKDDRTLELVTQTFAAIEQPIHALSIEGAESLKYACNAYHAVKITFANEIGRLLSAVDVDSRERDARVLRGRSPQHLVRVPSTRVLLRRIVPAQGLARPDAHRTDCGRRRADAQRRHAEQRVPPSAGDPTHSRHAASE